MIYFMQTMCDVIYVLEHVEPGVIILFRVYLFMQGLFRYIGIMYATSGSMCKLTYSRVRV